MDSEIGEDDLESGSGSELGSSEEEDSESDSSLGSTIERLEAEAAAQGRPTSYQLPFPLPPDRRTRSMSHIATDGTGPTNSLQQDSFSNFMHRMNTSSAPSAKNASLSLTLLQSPIFPSAGVSVSPAPVQQGVAVFGKLRTPRRSMSSNALEDMTKAETSSNKIGSPNNQFQNMLHNISPEFEASKQWLPESFWKNYFQPITVQRTQQYTMEIVKATRGEELPTLRQIFLQHAQNGSGVNPMDACNPQGESLLHLACRRCNPELVQFLVEECKVGVRVRDDWGKTPLHELCWNSQPRNPAQFQSVQLLLHHAPELMVARDKRGFLPFQYIPKASWRDWCRFLNNNQANLEWKLELLDFARAKDRLRETLASLHWQGT